VRPFGELPGSVGTPIVEVVSKVMSWSMNCPRKVVPAVWVGLFGLFALRLRSVISSFGPALRSSFASSGPSGAPKADSASFTRCVAGAKEGRSGKSRPNVVGLVATVALRTACARGAKTLPPETTTAPAPTPARSRKRRLL
jgi:hypothetical protein